MADGVGLDWNCDPAEGCSINQGGQEKPNRRRACGDAQDDEALTLQASLSS